MSFFKKFGGFLKKAAPVAGLASMFIPGMQGVGAALGAIGGLTGGGQPDPRADENGIGTPMSLPQGNVNVDAKAMPWYEKYAGLAAPMLSGGANILGAHMQNAANAKQAQQQMDFQAQQTGSSWQRGVADMRAAGLNPALAYSQGGAGSGSGSSAQLGNELGEGANSAFSTMMIQQELENKAAQVANIDANSELVRKQAKTEESRKLSIDQDVLTAPVNRGYTESRTEGQGYSNALEKVRKIIAERTLEEQAQQIVSNAKSAEWAQQGAHYGLNEKKAYAGFWDDVGKKGVYFREGQEAVSSALGGVGKVIGGVLRGGRKTREGGESKSTQ